MKYLFFLALLALAAANKQAPANSLSVEAISNFNPEQYMDSFVDQLDGQEVFWSVVAMFFVLAVHAMLLRKCLQKRAQRNRIEEEMKLKQLYFTETLISNGMDRTQVNRNIKTVHV